MIARDHTQKFDEYRERANAEKKENAQKEFLTFVLHRPIAQETKSENDLLKSFPNIFINKNKGGTLGNSNNNNSNNSNNSNNKQSTQQYMNLPHCCNCGKEFGIFTSKIQCDLCLILFCSNCIKKLSSKDITGVLREGQVKQYCPKCVFIVTREESKRRFEHLNKLATENPLVHHYNEIRLIRKAIFSAMPNYEYLASSVTDFSKISVENKQTFLQVYNEVTKLQTELSVLFKEFDKEMKWITSQPQIKNSLDETIQTNMKHSFVTFLQENLPKFKSIQLQVQYLELNTITNVYIILCRVSMDNQLHKSFWSKFQPLFQSSIQSIRKELLNCTVQCGENWDKHKNLVDEMICATDKSLLNLQQPPNKEFEGTLLRKNIEVVKKLIDQVNLRSNQDELLVTKQTLIELHKNLQDFYNKSMSFNFK